jgi:hypothetical protein
MSGACILSHFRLLDESARVFLFRVLFLRRIMIITAAITITPAIDEEAAIAIVVSVIDGESEDVIEGESVGKLLMQVLDKTLGLWVLPLVKE